MTATTIPTTEAALEALIGRTADAIMLLALPMADLRALAHVLVQPPLPRSKDAAVQALLAVSPTDHAAALGQAAGAAGKPQAANPYDRALTPELAITWEHARTVTTAPATSDQAADDQAAAVRPLPGFAADSSPAEVEAGKVIAAANQAALQQVLDEAPPRPQLDEDVEAMHAELLDEVAAGQAPAVAWTPSDAALRDWTPPADVLTRPDVRPWADGVRDDDADRGEAVRILIYRALHQHQAQRLTDLAVPDLQALWAGIFGRTTTRSWASNLTRHCRGAIANPEYVAALAPKAARPAPPTRVADLQASLAALQAAAAALVASAANDTGPGFDRWTVDPDALAALTALLPTTP